MSKSQIVDLHLAVQGEGRDTGTPCILVRFNHCNMNCQFTDSICDSAYASWNPEAGSYSLVNIENLILQNEQIKYALITGGNPSASPLLLQQVIDLFKEYDYYVAIEDNGTMFGNFKGINFVSLSPKLRNSVPIPGSIINDKYLQRTVTEADRVKHEKHRTNYTSMRQWILQYEYQLKFVVSNKEQLKEIEYVINQLGADRETIYLMPEGLTRAQLDSRRQWLVELCIETGFKYTDRLHIVTYDTKRDA